MGTRIMLALSRVDDFGLLALVLPDILGLFGHEVRDLRSHVAGRDGVSASELDPFDGQRTAWMSSQR